MKYATLLIQNEKYVRDCLEAKFPWILVDEYQDLGKPLHEMVLSMFFKSNIKIFAVGDPSQSIYSFNGAIPDYLLELYRHPQVCSIELLTNYRSNQDIINASILALTDEQRRNFKAGLRIDENAEFHFIECYEEMYQQYEQVVSRVIPECIAQGISYEEICVMVGKNDQANEMGQYLKQAGIPFYVSKLNFGSSTLSWTEKMRGSRIDETIRSG